VVTTAACVYGNRLSSISVRSGSTYSNSGGTLHSATNIIIHENYDFSEYDVAVVQVSPAFTFNDSVQPITLECDPVPVGTDVVLTGWGGVTAGSQPLQQVTLQTISDSSCNSTYVFNGLITDRMICAKDPDGVKAACSDIGAPLVTSSRLVGMYSRAGCNPPYPQVYAKVSALCDWIVINAGLYKVSADIN